jgi:hypothetical protein
MDTNLFLTSRRSRKKDDTSLIRNALVIGQQCVNLPTCMHTGSVKHTLSVHGSVSEETLYFCKLTFRCIAIFLVFSMYSGSGT